MILHVQDNLQTALFSLLQQSNLALKLPLMNFEFTERYALTSELTSVISQIIRQPEQRSLSMAPSPHSCTVQHVSEAAPVEGADVTNEL